MAARVAPEWCNLTVQRMQRPLSVCFIIPYTVIEMLTTVEAKFTGYQYGGRPLGLTFVKYQNANGGDAMEGTEDNGGLTQDQIM